MLTTHSKSTVRLDQVVLTTTYGSPVRTARSVYFEAERDLTGVLGIRSRALYAFAIPGSDLWHVSTYVDFDGRHAVGAFTSSVK